MQHTQHPTFHNRPCLLHLWSREKGSGHRRLKKVTKLPPSIDQKRDGTRSHVDESMMMEGGKELTIGSVWLDRKGLRNPGSRQAGTRKKRNNCLKLRQVSPLLRSGEEEEEEEREKKR